MNKRLGVFLLALLITVCVLFSVKPGTQYGGVGLLVPTNTLIEPAVLSDIVNVTLISSPSIAPIF